MSTETLIDPKVTVLNADGPNDQHFMEDHLAMIQASRTVPGFSIEVPAFCYTSLLTSAPKLLLNVESDDYGTVDQRSCGCTWETLGFPTHLRDIRSFRKLTGEGVTRATRARVQALWTTTASLRASTGPLRVAASLTC